MGINTFKSLKNGKVPIETNSKEEIEALEKDIKAKCGSKLEVNIHKLRNPTLVILNIPEDISTGNLEDTLIAQNPDLNLKKGDIKAKFSYETKKHIRNLVTDVGTQTSKQLLQKKVKLGWLIWKIEDYVVANRGFKCSRFNHRFRDCRGEETCPLCAGSHKLKECTATSMEYKCINCLTYNKHNQNKKSVTTTPHSTRIALVYKKSWRSTDKTRITEMGNNRNTNTMHYNKMHKMQTQMKCTRNNLQHSRIATDNLAKIIEEDGTDILCIQEPYMIQNKVVGIPTIYKIFTSGEGRNLAAIVVTSNQVNIITVRLTFLAHSVRNEKK